MRSVSKSKKQRADAAYERFLHILKWVLCIAAAYVVLNISYKIIWNTFHLDGSLPVKDGRVQASDHDLIANHGTRASPKYFAYARINTPEGYTHKDSGILNDSNETDFLFSASNPETAVDQIYVAVASSTHEVSAATAQQLFKDGFEACEVQPITNRTLCGRNAITFAYQYTQNGVTKYGLNAYFDTDPYAIVLSLTDTEAEQFETCLQSAEEWLRITRKEK